MTPHKFFAFSTALLVSVCVSIYVASTKPAAADESETLAKGYCVEMEETLNILTADWNTTTCRITPGQNSWIYFLMADQGVFGVEQTRKAWLIAVVATFGSLLNSNTMTADAVVVTDSKLVTDGVAFLMESNTARNLQRQTKAGEISLDDLYISILDDLVPMDLGSSN